MSERNNSNCPNCNAPFSQFSQQCDYCGSYIVEEKRGLGKENEDFGIAKPMYLIFILIIAAVLYGLGWRYEDMDFLLSDAAVIIWAGAIPIWLATTAFLWKAGWGQWLPGFAISIPIFLFHLLIIWMIKGRVNDDALGISAMFAFASLFAWFLGRLFHNYIRKIRAGS